MVAVRGHERSAIFRDSRCGVREVEHDCAQVGAKGCEATASRESVARCMTSGERTRPPRRKCRKSTQALQRLRAFRNFLGPDASFVRSRQACRAARKPVRRGGTAASHSSTSTGTDDTFQRSRRSIPAHRQLQRRTKTRWPTIDVSTKHNNVHRDAHECAAERVSSTEMVRTTGRRRRRPSQPRTDRLRVTTRTSRANRREGTAIIATHLARGTRPATRRHAARPAAELQRPVTLGSIARGLGKPDRRQIARETHCK